MIRLYTADRIQSVTPSIRELVETYFDPSLVKRIQKGVSKEVVLRSYTSRMMLYQIFKELQIAPSKLRSLYYDQKGKLVMPSSSIQFSLTYAKDQVVCLISENRIGIDMENVKTEIPSSSKVLFEKLTQQKLSTSIEFYEMWTRVESIKKIIEDKSIFELLQNYEDLKDCFQTFYMWHKKQYLIAISSHTNTKVYMERIDRNILFAKSNISFLY